MKHEAPPRLKYTPGAPPELAEALDALGQASSDRARVARVEQKLGALLDAPLASQSAWVQHVLLKSLAGKLLATTLLASVGASWLLRPDPTQSALPTSSVQAPPPDADATPFGPPDDGHARRGADDLTIEHAAPQVEESREPPLSKPVRSHAAPSATALPATDDRSQRVRSRARSPMPTASNKPVATAALDAKAEPVTDHADTLPAPRPAAPPAPPPKAPPREAELLLSARKQLHSDPRGTLVLLEQHAALFPNGMLAPEREVLAIEALRKSGRDAEASERLARFRAHYPDSPHLRGLR